MIKSIIFDMDGVLVDSKPVALWAFLRALDEFKFEFDLKTLRDNLGIRTIDLMKLILSDKDKSKAEDIAKRIVELLTSEYAQERITLVKYAKEAVEKLKDHYKLAIITRSERPYAQKALETLGFTLSWFEKIVAADDGYATKEEAIIKILEENHLNKEEIVYVGDMTKDIEVAKNTGIKIIAITGWHSEEDLKSKNPDKLIYKMLELPKAIAELK